MNYRHAFHAGNFADVMKHAVFAWVIEALKRKDAPFRVVDTHAGAGLYDLSSDPAERTGEWRDGIGRLFGSDAQTLPPSVREYLKPYLDVVAGLNPDATPRRYPGSPWIADRLLRRGDCLVANELHPEDGTALRRVFATRKGVKILELDAWTALKALLPPPERRGVVLIDPPFEQPRELDRLVEGLVDATRRFAGGVYLLWYPIKDRKPVARFHAALADLGLDKVLRAELMIRSGRDPARLNGAGLIIHNPPYGLIPMLEEVLPVLADQLQAEHGARSTVDWLVPERRSD
jgi:23S rRNA (adenine2030-N6)-methyltransferase